MQRLHQEMLKYMGEIGEMGTLTFYNSQSSLLFTACVNS